uniref:Transposase protein n=1 Tax=Solanum tuberosum TaxID=4113 RepID=M0ZQY6_SOLTU
MCCFGKWKTRDEEQDHLVCKPFPQNYVIWNIHGEKKLLESSGDRVVMQETFQPKNPIETMINDTFRQYRQQASDGGTSQLLSSTETSNDMHMEDTGDFHNFLKDGSEKLELGNFKPFVRIKSQLEGSIAKGHIAEETLTFFSQYMEDTETRFNRPRRVRDDPNYIQPSGMSTIFPQLS